MAKAKPTVTYRAVPGHAGYRVGDDGSVWSSWHRSGVAASGSGSRSVFGGPWRLLKASKSKSGRRAVGLYPNGRRTYVSHLVLLAFVGPRPDGMEACHEDDDSTNDALSNLRWDTHKANSADAVRNGRTPHGERNGMSKLTPDQIRLIRADHAAGGLSYERLAAKHQLGIATVFGIVKRSAWKHVSD